MDAYDKISFDSIYALGAHVQELLKNNDAREYGTSSTRGSNTAFFGDLTMEGAVAMALKGGLWPAGIACLPALDNSPIHVRGRMLHTSCVSSDIVGFAPNIPSYLAGLPDAMLQVTPQPTTTKLLKVAINVACSASTTQQQLNNRGNAIVAILDKLITDGYNVEVWAVVNGQETEGFDAATVGFEIKTKIKDAASHWSPASIAFAICHVGFARRLGFRVLESLTGKNNAVALTRTSYGVCGVINPDEYDCVFDGLPHKRRSAYDTMEGALALTQRELKNHMPGNAAQ